MRALAPLLALALALVQATAALAAPPPPPMPRPPGAPSPCTVTGRVPVSLTVAPAAARDQPVTLAFDPDPAFKGKMKVDWQVEIAIADPALRQQVGRIVDMEFSARYGLFAVTSGGFWLSLDLKGGRLDGLREVQLARMDPIPNLRDAAAPTWISLSAYDQATVIFQGAGVQARYDLRACGAAARAETSPYPTGQTGWTLDGYRFRTASDPDRLVPDLRMGQDDRWALWRPLAGSDHTLLQIRRSNVASAGPEEIAGRFNQPLAALASLWDDDSQVVRLWLARDGGEPGVFVLYSARTPDA